MEVADLDQGEAKDILREFIPTKSPGVEQGHRQAGDANSATPPDREAVGQAAPPPLTQEPGDPDKRKGRAECSAFCV